MTSSAPTASAFDGRLPQPLRLFLILLLTLGAVSLLDTVAGVTHGRPWARVYLWPPYAGFDFVDYTSRFGHLHTPLFFELPAYPWYYPAPAIFVLYPFYKLAAVTSRAIGFAIFVLTVSALDLLALRRLQTAMVQRGLRPGSGRLLLWGTLLFGWPIYFGLQRGNIESLLWLGSAAAITCLIHRRYTAAALLLGVVGSVKLYPLLFLALLLRPRRFREIALGLGTAALTTLAALRFLERNVSFAWQQVNSGIHRWTLENMANTDTLGVDHSLFGLFRLFLHGPPSDATNYLRVYLAVAAVVATAIFLLLVLRLPRPNQLLFLACATVLLPPVSYDYTLVGILIPWGWLTLLCVEQARAGQDVRRWYLPFILFAVALAPMSFLHGHGAGFFYFQGSVRAVSLLALAVVSVIMPIPEMLPAEAISQSQ